MSVVPFLLVFCETHDLLQPVFFRKLLGAFSAAPTHPAGRFKIIFVIKVFELREVKAKSVFGYFFTFLLRTECVKNSAEINSL